jgi:hypothetical protein
MNKKTQESIQQHGSEAANKEIMAGKKPLKRKSFKLDLRTIPDWMIIGCDEPPMDPTPLEQVEAGYKFLGRYEDDEQDFVYGPDWGIEFENKLRDWKHKTPARPILFHLPTRCTEEIQQKITSIARLQGIGIMHAKGNGDDSEYTLSSASHCEPLITCWSAPDSAALRSAWHFVRGKYVWLWVSPLAPSWMKAEEFVTLPCEIPHFVSEVIEENNTVLLTDPIALQRQLSGLKTAGGTSENKRHEGLRDLGKPKALLIANAEHCNKLTSLQKQLPQYSSLLQELRAMVLAQAAANKPLNLGRLLLVGAPGNGKSWLCEQIAKALKLPFLIIQLAGNNDTMVLRGSQPQWSNADAGRPVKFIASCSVANPLIIIDEVDKTPANSPNGNLTDTLLMLLEPENARQFMDNFLETPINMSFASYMLTANNIDRLESHFISRVRIQPISAPNHAEMRNLAAQLYQKHLATMGLSPYFAPELNEQELDLLVIKCPNIRTLKERINKAVLNALVEIPDLETLQAQQHSLRIHPEPPIEPPATGMGFIRH